ncbi:MAG: hypothetical protein Q9O62_09295, partial [Ardenticatenia bacterium]|nr:hypothetical protein [Ardenticatenia bacterium]
MNHDERVEPTDQHCHLAQHDGSVARSATARPCVALLQASPARTSLVTWLTLFVDVLGQLSVAQRLTVSLVMLVILVVAFLLLVLELRPAPKEALIPVRTAEGGETVVAASAVQRRLQWVIDQLDDVVDVEPNVRPKGDGVEVFPFVRTSPNIDV